MKELSVGGMLGHTADLPMMRIVQQDKIATGSRLGDNSECFLLEQWLHTSSASDNSIVVEQHTLASPSGSG